MGTRAHRPRRAVRPSGTVGTDESVLRSVLPAVTTPEGAPAGPAVAAGTEPRRSPAGTGDEPRGPVTVGAVRVGTGTSGRRSRRVVSGSTSSDPADDLWRTTRSADDSDQGWGRPEPSSNDERLLREKPPHW